MGNCQASEAAAAEIQHPGGRVERIYWSLTAGDVMASNPGHYVAVIITSNGSNPAVAPVKHLKLLRPDDTLHIGHVYRLVSFEDVLKEFGSKKRVRLNRVLAEKEEETRGDGGRKSNPVMDSSSPVAEQRQEQSQEGENGMGDIMGPAGQRSNVAVVGKHGQWRPTLQSISEVGS